MASEVGGRLFLPWVGQLYVALASELHLVLPLIVLAVTSEVRHPSLLILLAMISFAMTQQVGGDESGVLSISCLVLASEVLDSECEREEQRHTSKIMLFAFGFFAFGLGRTDLWMLFPMSACHESRVLFLLLYMSRFVALRLGRGGLFMLFTMSGLAAASEVRGGVLFVLIARGWLALASDAKDGVHFVMYRVLLWYIVMSIIWCRCKMRRSRQSRQEINLPTLWALSRSWSLPSPLMALQNDASLSRACWVAVQLEFFHQMLFLLGAEIYRLQQEAPQTVPSAHHGRRWAWMLSVLIMALILAAAVILKVESLVYLIAFKLGRAVENHSLKGWWKDESEMSTCFACMQSLPAASFPSFHGHVSLCRPCYRQHVAARMDMGLAITCPVCQEDLDDMSDLFKWYPVELWNVNRYQLQRYLQHAPDIFWCTMPGCHHAIVQLPSAEHQECSQEHRSAWRSLKACWKKEEGRFCFGRHFPCEACGAEHCRLCGRAWQHEDYTHDNLSCDEFAAGLQILTRVPAMPAHMHNCPRCSTLIQKDGGCNHMTCRCGHQFCWICGQNWSLWHTCTPNGWLLQQALDLEIPLGQQRLWRHALACFWDGDWW